MALGDGAGAASANSLRLLKSLIMKKKWTTDQSMLVLTLAKIAKTQVPRGSF